MITTIVTLLGGLRATAFAVAALLAFGMAGTQTYRLHSEQTALAQLQASVADTEAKAQATTRVESERRDTSSSSATQSMLDYLGHNLPTIEATSHDTLERIRTVYRDRPVAAVCTRPDRVRIELDQARARANGAASSGLPAHTAGTGPADPIAGQDGRVGHRGDGNHRDGAGEVDRRAGLHGQAQGGSGGQVTPLADANAERAG